MHDRIQNEGELRRIPLRGEAGSGAELTILPEPYPPRQEEDFTELASSVRLHGVLCPLLLRPAGGRLQIVCGYRRYLAAKAAGLKSVPVMILTLSDAEAIRCYLSENVFRRALRTDAQREALQALKRLRECRSAAPPEAGISREASLQQKAQPSRLKGGRVSQRGSRLCPEAKESKESQPTSPGSQPEPWPQEMLAAGPAPGTPAAARLCAAMEKVLAETLSTRSIDPSRAENLADELLDFLSSSPPLSLLGLYGSKRQSAIAPHSLLVAALAEHVARFLGWEREAARRLLLGGLLHDVGMVFIEGTGLYVPGSLSPAQRASLPRHTRIGYALIGAAGAWEDEVAQCARDHHERWNGSGYPAGRSGTQLSRAASLMAYLDTFAALISPRPHRDPLRPNAALSRLAKASELGLFNPAHLGGIVAALGDSALLEPTGAPPASATDLPDPSENSVELVGAGVKMPIQV